MKYFLMNKLRYILINGLFMKYWAKDKKMKYYESC
jgi:hypothetical protein